MLGGEGGVEAQRELFELTQSLAHIGVWTLEEATGVITWSREFNHIVGREPDELEMTLDALLAIIPPDDQPTVVQNLSNAMAGGDSGPWEQRIDRPDGEPRFVEVRATLVRPGHLMGVVQDVTDRVRSERELLDERARLYMAQELGHFAELQIDVAAGTVAWGPEMFHIVGRSPDDFHLDLRAALSTVHPDDLELAMETLAGRMRGEPATPVQLRILRPDGEVRWIESHLQLVEGGRLLGFVQDVTDWRALDDERQLHTKILELMSESVAVIGGSPARYLYVNPRFAADMHTTPEEIIGAEPWQQLVDDSHVEELRATLARAGRWEGDVPGRRPDGTRLISHVSLTSMVLPGLGPVNLAVCSDVTMLRRQEAELRQSEERHRLIQAHSPIGMGLMSLELHWLEVNAALADILGRDVDAIPGLSLREVTHPDDVAGDAVLIESLLRGDRDSYQREKRYVRPDGRIVWVLVSVFLLRDEFGVAQCFVGQVIDTTDRKDAEIRLRTYASQIEEASDAKTRFLSRMSHELRTPLNAVLGYGQLLAMADLGSEDVDSVEQILNAGRHLLELIDEVLDITSVEAGSLQLAVEAFDLSAVIEDAVQLVQPMAAGHGVTISVVDSQDVTTFADRRRVTQILLNLLSNAIKYNRPGGTVTITSTIGPGPPVGPGPTTAEEHDDAVVVEHAVVHVEDTGRGIPADALARVFDPFDRLGADQLGIQGTGIGLPLARSLAERMGGTLTVRSHHGQGSTFSLTLPTGASGDGSSIGRRDQVAVHDQDVRAVRVLRVVHIEDDPANRLLVEAALRRRSGIEVLAARTGREGLRIATEVRPDLVLLDLHLPDMAGSDVLRLLKTGAGGAAPAVVVISGDADLEQINSLIALGADQYLTKPLDLEALYAVVAELVVDDRS